MDGRLVSFRVCIEFAALVLTVIHFCGDKIQLHCFVVHPLWFIFICRARRFSFGVLCFGASRVFACLAVNRLENINVSIL
jgi:hypothetical protein